MAKIHDFLRKWQPAFSGSFAIGEFKHLNPLKRVSVSRSQGMCCMITNQAVSLIDLHIKIQGDSSQQQGVVGIEEALDLMLLSPYNLLSTEQRQHQNMYKILSQQSRTAEFY